MAKGWLDQYFDGYSIVQSNGAPLPQRNTVNFLNSTAVDNPGNQSTDVTPGVSYPLTNPTVQGTSDYYPTTAQVASFGIVGARVKQAFWGGSGSVTVGYFPLPGQAGAPITAGGIHVDVLHKMSGTGGGGSGVGATFKSSASWQVTAGGVVMAEQASASQPVATGTNSNAPPAGWSSTLQLNAGSTEVEVVIAGSGSSSIILAQALYCQ